MNKKGQFALGFSFIVIVMILLFIFTILMPMLANWSTSMFVGSEDITNATLSKSEEIQDPAIRASVQEVYANTKDSYVTQQQIFGTMTTYAVIIIILIVAMGFFLSGRSNVERQLV